MQLHPVLTISDPSSSALDLQKGRILVNQIYLDPLVSPSTSLLSVWKFLPQPSSQVPPALAHQRGRSFLLCCLGLSSPALSAPDTLLCPHLGHVPSHDTGNFVTTCKWACLSKLLGSSKRKQPQFIGKQPKSLRSPFPGAETG